MKPRPPISEQTREKMRAAKLGKTGTASNGWAGGHAKHTAGYALIRVRNHYVLEHRHIMEAHLGRPLSDREIVHHKNENRTDNRLENLEVMGRGDHNRHHFASRTLTEKQLTALRIGSAKLAEQRRGKKLSPEVRANMCTAQRLRRLREGTSKAR